MVTAETLTIEAIMVLAAELRSAPLTADVRDLLLDCSRAERAIRIGIGLVETQIPHWYYDEARRVIATAINARTAVKP